MSDQQDIWASIREKLDWEEVDYLNSVMDKQNNALEETGRNLEELQRLLGQLKESTLDVATDQFSQEIEDHERESAGSRQVRFDPDFILEESNAEVVVGNGDVTFFTNESATKFIEKYLLLAWTALKNSDHFNEEAAPGLLHDQEPGDTTMDIISKCITQISVLTFTISNGETIIV